MKKKKLNILIIIVSLLILIISLIYIRKNILISNRKISAEEENNIDKFEISKIDENNILIVIQRANGINKIERPDGKEIIANNNKEIAIDYEVERDKKYTIKITDSNGNETEETIYAPSYHIEMTKNKVDLVLEEFRNKLESTLLSKNIATNFVTFGIGQESHIETETTDMQTVFNSWTKFGDGNWGYDSNNKWIYNTKNSETMTGYYDPNGEYNDIDLEFEARTTDADDDMIGAMIRFNKNGTNYNSYLFLLDRHDNGGGIINGAYNGINKIINQNLVNQNNITKLNVNAGLRWTRNAWQKYKFKVQNNKIEAFIDGALVASTTDNNIEKGTYGFLSYSQAYTYFRNIVLYTNKENTLEDIMNSIEWNEDEKNMIIRFNNEDEPLLDDEGIKDKFTRYNIHYMGVGSDTNKDRIENFLEYLEKKGNFIQGTLEDEEIYESIASYIEKVVKQD